MSSSVSITDNNDGLSVFSPIIEFENFEALIEEHLQKGKIPQAGEVVTGIVTDVENGVVTVDVGLKSEGRIALSEFSEDPNTPADIKVGDQVEVYVDRIEGRGGLAVLSREKAIKSKAWTNLADIQKSGGTIEGVIIAKVRGGMAVDFGGIIAFLPGSQIDMHLSRDTVRDLTPLISTRQQFKILKMDDEHGNVVVSHRAILEEARQEACEEFLGTISEGMVVEGTVKNMTGYGAFVTIGPVDALLHITDISWHKIAHPSDVLSIGQTLTLKVTKYNPQLKRVSVGLKQLEANPWEELKDKYVKGTKAKGTVTNICDYGAFVQLEPNIEGLVYRDEMHWTAREVHPDKLVKVGDTVEVMILDVDVEGHRISLSIKRCQPNAWEEFIKENPLGSKIEVNVKAVCDFGLFVIKKADESKPYPVNILIPVAELSWGDGAAELEKYRKGDALECLISNVEVERERVTASVKMGQDDEVARAVAAMIAAPSSIAKVKEVKKDGISVEFAPGITAFVAKSELSSDKVDQKASNFNVGDDVELKVTGFDQSTRQAIASIKALEVARHDEVRQKYGSNDSGGSNSIAQAIEEGSR